MTGSTSDEAVESAHSPVSVPTPYEPPEPTSDIGTTPAATPMTEPEPEPEPVPEPDPFSDSIFKPLSSLRIPDDVTIVSFGEATHGSHDFKYLAGELFKQLVLEEGFHAFTTEAPFGGCIAINDYILHGIGTAKRAVASNGYWVHNFQEVVDLVEWMRRYNRTADESEKLRFYGYDIQDTVFCRYRYLTYMDAVDADKANRDRAVIGDYSESIFSSTPNRNDYLDIIRRIDLMIEEAEQNKESYIMLSSGSEYAFAIRNLVCLKYYLERETVSSGERFAYRDRRMYENFQWIVEQEESLGRGKAFVFGHNSHIMKIPERGATTIGMHIAAEYGERYFAIGTEFLNSTFRAWQRNIGVQEFTVRNEANPLIGLFAETSMELGLILMDDYAGYGEDMARLLTRTLQLGCIGSSFHPSYCALPERYACPRAPAYAYDALIFVRDSTSATPVR